MEDGAGDTEYAEPVGCVAAAWVEEAAEVGSQVASTEAGANCPSMVAAAVAAEPATGYVRHSPPVGPADALTTEVEVVAQIDASFSAEGVGEEEQIHSASEAEAAVD